MEISDFLDLCRKNGYSEKDIIKFSLAIEIISPLKDQKRISAEDNFFEHNLRVGKILIENKLMSEVVIAGICHSINDKDLLKKIKNQFGEEVLALINGVEEVKRIKYQNQKLEAEALRKIILTTLEDVRVIIIQLANKIDNLQSLDVLSKEDQKRIAEEVLEFYAPLAYRLGLEKMKGQLESFSFKYLNPKMYKDILNFLQDSQEQRDKFISNAIDLIKEIADDKVKILKIKGRTKQIYSIYKKIVDRKVPLDEQYDLYGIRIIVPSIKDCYTLLGLLHENFEPLDDRLKDYIANPKPNGYRSIHTGVRLDNGRVLEVQIRTSEMDEIAEEGIAAHWRYKGLSSEQLFEKKVSWLKNILELQKDLDHKEFLETAKVDLFGDNIYCYTPKGDVKELPKGSTLLDFAFLIHEHIGSTAVGGKINGKFMPLRTELNQGDIVEIVTNKNQRPRRSWLKIVKSGKAKQKIRKFVKQHETLPALHYRKVTPDIAEEQGVLVESEELPNAICVLAKCCNPIPDENVVGVVTKRRVVSVHKDDCKQTLKDDLKLVEVNWKDTFNQKINFYIEAGERSGLLADLLHTIASAGFEVKGAKAKMINVDRVQCSFMIIPKDLENLKYLIMRVRKVKGVRKIYFE